MPIIELLGSGSAGFGTVSGVTTSIGTLNGIPSLTGLRIGKDDAALSYFGGVRGRLSPTSAYDTIYNLTLSDGSTTGMGGRVAFDTNATAFELQLPGSGPNVRIGLYVNGLRADLPLVTVPDTGGTYYVKFDLSGYARAGGWNSVEVEFYNGGTFGDIVLSEGSEMSSFSNSGPRVAFLGDSFSEGTGASSPQNDYASLVGHALGTADIWQSAFGGTGYARPLGNRPALVDRIGTDGVAAQADIYVVAMGINDSGDITDEVRQTLATLTAGVPTAKIFVIGSWNAWAPAPIGNAAIVDQIRSVAHEFPSVVYLDSSTVEFSKAGTTHPDDSGHLILAKWLSAQIEEHLLMDGAIFKDIAGDVVGPLFIKDFDPLKSYSYAVFENGLPSARFEIIPTGDAFPILRLKAGASVGTVGGMTVQLRITDEFGQTSMESIQFSVRDSVVGTSGDETLTTTSIGVLMLGDGGNDVIHGSAGDDRLLGGLGDDVIFALGGSDVAVGGLGDDIYEIDSSDDIVRELNDEGSDTIRTSMVTTYLPENVEVLVLGAASLNGSGNELANELFGNAAANQLYGLGGLDRLYGGDGDDSLDGGIGADQMFGGSGNDSYRVSDVGDSVFEQLDQGLDLITTEVSLYLPENVENLTLGVRSGDIFGVGNDLDNLIVANNGVNLLLGGNGRDQILGREGADILFGEAGNDQLYGDSDGDVLVGGIGDDILEGGSGADAMYGETGNDLIRGGTSFDTDILVGGEGNDTLHGISGQANPDYDLMDGGNGNDTYNVDTGDDLTFEAPSGGIDTVFANVPVAGAGVYLWAHVENLVLQGNTAFGVGNELANQITGSASSNWLLGGQGGDLLNGKNGNDVLFGEAGADTFVFEAGGGSDVIGDFEVGIDKIRIAGYGLDWSSLMNLFIQVGSDGAIRFSNGDLIVLQNVDMSALSSTSFTFA